MQIEAVLVNVQTAILSEKCVLFNPSILTGLNPSKVMGLAPSQPKEADIRQGIATKRHGQRLVAVAQKADRRQHI
jgi:hypothetical protein